MLDGKERKLAVWCMIAAFAGATALIPMGCEQQGPAEEAGESIDEGIEDAGDAIEDAGDEIEDGLDG